MNNEAELDLSERVIILSPMHSFCSMIACVVKDTTDEEILNICNELNHPGTKFGWTTVIRDHNHLKYGEKCKPIECQKNKERIHLIVVC